MPNLKQDHEYLYKRVRLKALLHIALGMVLVFLPSAVPSNSAQPSQQMAQQGVSELVNSLLTYFGIVYIAIGIFIGVGIYRSRENYSLARLSMTVAAIYNTFWLALIFAIALQTRLNRSIAYIAVIYSYMVYNLWYVRGDPGWRAIEFIRQEGIDNERGHSPTK